MEEGWRSQRERGSLSLFPGPERRKNNWGANGCLFLFLVDLLLPLIPSLLLESLGHVERTAQRRRGLLAQNLRKI